MYVCIVEFNVPLEKPVGETSEIVYMLSRELTNSVAELLSNQFYCFLMSNYFIDFVILIFSAQLRFTASWIFTAHGCNITHKHEPDNKSIT